MASGHMNRVKRPDTWLHRPMLQNVKKVLANPEPSTHDPETIKEEDERGASARRRVSTPSWVAQHAFPINPRLACTSFTPKML